MLKNTISKIAEYALKDDRSLANFLKWSAAFNFGIGSVGYTLGLAINDKLPKKEKPFMVMQEAVQGVLNIAIFLLIASSFQKFGRMLVKSGKILPGIEGLKRPEVAKYVTQYFDDAVKLAKSNPKIESAIRTFVSGSEVVTSLLGTIVAFNLVSPFLRNLLASKLQKKGDKKLDIKEQGAPVLPSLKLGNKTNIDPANPFNAFNKAMTVSGLAQRTVVSPVTALRI